MKKFSGFFTILFLSLFLMSAQLIGAEAAERSPAGMHCLTPNDCKSNSCPVNLGSIFRLSTFVCNPIGIPNEPCVIANKSLDRDICSYVGRGGEKIARHCQVKNCNRGRQDCDGTCVDGKPSLTPYCKYNSQGIDTRKEQKVPGNQVKLGCPSGQECYVIPGNYNDGGDPNLWGICKTSHTNVFPLISNSFAANSLRAPSTDLCGPKIRGTCRDSSITTCKGGWVDNIKDGNVVKVNYCSTSLNKNMKCCAPTSTQCYKTFKKPQGRCQTLKENGGTQPCAKYEKGYCPGPTQVRCCVR